MKKEFNQKAFSEFKESIISERQRIVNIIVPSNMMMCQTLTENKAKNFLKECAQNNIPVELNTNNHESIEDFMDYIAHLYHAKGLALEDTDKPTVNDMIKYYHICQCDAIIYQNDEVTDEELFNDFGVMPLDMLDDKKLKEYVVLFEAFEKHVAYYNKEDKSELLYDLCKQKRKQSVKVDDDIRQIMYSLIGWRSVDEEDVTSSGNLIFRNNYDEKSVKFCGKDGEYYHFITSGYYGMDDEYEESDYFVKIENGAAYTYEDGIIDSLVICLNKTSNDSFYIKNGTGYIYDLAFKDCNFNNIIVPDSMHSISKDEFFPSNIKKITLKSKRTLIHDKKDECFIGTINIEKSELESLIKEDGSLVIPNDITEIPGNTFKDCTSLKSIIIPDSVTSIGNYAFDGCSSLTEIIIPVSVTSIGKSAFEGCSSLTKVNYTGTIDQWVKIMFDSNYSNPLCNAKNLYINNELVTEANITTATEINDYALNSYTSLTSVIIGGSVTIIGSCAFKNCSSLTGIKIPNNVTSIGSEAFSGCTSLMEIAIPSSVTSIGFAAFSDCSSLKSVIIPDSVTSIGNYAFKNCSSLTGIKIPNNVTDIKDGIFDNCSSLTNIEIHNGVTSIGNYAFSGCTSLKEVVISNSVTSVGKSAFSGCSGLTSIVIGDSVTSIGERAFYDCSSLTNVVIGNSVTNIGYRVFYNCSSLTSITVDSNNKYYKSIDGNLYSKDGKKLIQYGVGKTDASFVIPNSVTTIGGYAFKDCSSLTNVVIGNSVKDIYYHAFDNCSSLTSIIIPDSVTSIGEFAFYGCKKLTNVVIPDSVKIIHYGAFNCCDLLERNF